MMQDAGPTVAERVAAAASAAQVEVSHEVAPPLPVASLEDGAGPAMAAAPTQEQPPLGHVQLDGCQSLAPSAFAAPTAVVADGVLPAGHTRVPVPNGSANNAANSDGWQWRK
jgi:hypothetical protein